MSMNEEQIPPKEEVDVKDQADPTSQVQADPPATASGKEAPVTRDDLVKQLMQEPVVEDKAPVVEDKVEIEEADEEPAEQVETSKATEDEPAKTSTEPDILDDKRLGERTRKTVVALRSENKELKQKAAFGDLITQIASDAKVSPDELADWVGLASRLKKGDATAVDRLIATAKAFGYTEPKATPAEKRITVDDVADKIYREEFASDVENLEIGEAAAKKYARKLAEERLKAEAPEPQEKRPAPQQAQKVQDPVKDQALAMIDNLETQFRTSTPEYKNIEKRVYERLTSEYGKQNPIMWVAGYQDIVREELRKAAPPVKRESIKPVAGTQVRASSAPAPKPAAELDPRAKLLADLMSGAFAPNRK